MGFRVWGLGFRDLTPRMWTAISALSCSERPARSSIWPLVSCTLTQRREVPRDLSSSTLELWPSKFPCEVPYNEQLYRRCLAACSERTRMTRKHCSMHCVSATSEQRLHCS